MIHFVKLFDRWIPLCAIKLQTFRTIYFDVLLIWASCVYIISYCRGRFYSPCYAFWHIFSWNTCLASLSGIPTSVLRLLVSTCTRGHADLEACWAHSLHTVERDTCGERRQILESGWNKFPPLFLSTLWKSRHHFPWANKYIPMEVQPDLQVVI